MLCRIRTFPHVSGLNLKENRSTILLVGKNQAFEAYLGNIKCREKMKILGVIFSSKSAAGELKNTWENIVDTIERTLSVWSKRDPSINLKKKT